jgi:predicted nucleotidyltransferase
MNSNEIDIGELIHQKLKEAKRSVAWLAGKTHTDSSTLRRKLKKKSIDTDLLQEISDAYIVIFFDTM